MGQASKFLCYSEWGRLANGRGKPPTLGVLMRINVRGTLEEFKIPTNIKLALLWASLMFLYLYNDYFSMYVPGTIDSMAKGSFGPVGQATDALLVGMSVLLAVPSLMIFLSAVLTPRLNRWLNVVLGLVYTVIECFTLLGSPVFYRIIVVAEVILTAFIVLYALRWPRHTT